MTTQPAVDPYGSDYLNSTGKYNPNNSTLGVHDPEGDMKDGGGGMIYNAILDGFLSIVMFFVTGLFQLLNGALDTTIKMVTFTPAPEWGGGWYQNPSNMIWPEKYHDWKTNGQPWTFFICIVSTGLYLGLGHRGLGILSARHERAGTKHLVIAWIMAFWGWQVVGFWLNIANALGYGITADLTGSTLMTNGLKGVLLIGLLIIGIWNIWIFLVILSLVSLRYIGLTALTPWIPFFFALKAVPVRGLGMIGDGLTKLWLLLSLITLPISIALSVGFSPMTTDIFSTYGVEGVQLIAMQLGTALACLVIPYFMYQKGGQALASVGVVGSAPTAEGMQRAYQDQLERAGELKESTAQRVNEARDTHRGFRGAEPVTDGGSGYMTGQAGRQTIQTYSQTINERVTNLRGSSEPTDSDPELEQLRDQRLESLKAEMDVNNE